MRMSALSGVVVALFVVVGVYLGTTHQRAFVQADPFSDLWSIVTPRHQVGWGPGGVHYGIHVVDGALTIQPREFYFSDTLVSEVGPISRLRVTMGPGSATVVVKMGDARQAYAHLESDGLVLEQPRTPIDGVGSVHEFSTSEGELHYVGVGGNTPIGPYEPGPVELSIVQGAGRAGRIAKVEAWAEDGEALISEDMTGAGQSAYAAGVGGLIGGLMGLCLVGGLRARRDFRAALPMVVWAALPGLALWVPAAEWLRWAERFYLSETPPWWLASGVLGTLMIPAVMAGLVGSGLLELQRNQIIQADRQVRPWFVCWGLLSVLALGRGGMGLDGLEFLWLLPMALFLLSPLWMMRRVGFRSARWLAMDMVSLLALIALGWGWGLLTASMYRLALVASSAGVFIARGPRPAVQYLLLLFLTLPLALEVSIRTTYLGRVWDSAELGLAESEVRGWKMAVVTWSESCGPQTAPTTKRLVFAGGSSTGSFNSYDSVHIRYFPELIHAELCASLPPGYRLQTVNYGGGDRNTFTIAHTLDQMFSEGMPALFVVYGGVNDIFSRRHRLTRKQRYLAQESHSGTTQDLKSLTGKLRLVSGMGLPLRAMAQGSDQVSEVPLEDAEENHRLIASSMGERPVLLLTERVRSDHADELLPYERMQAKLAEEDASIHHLSLTEMMPQGEVERLLVDSPHYSQEGHAAFADTILPEVERLVFGQEAGM